MRRFIKRFKEWIGIKEKLDLLGQHMPLFKESEIWWCAMGENIGVEISGKGKGFSRPVLVFKKFSQHGFLGIPLSTKKKESDWYLRITFRGRQSTICFNQTRFFSIKRLYNKFGMLSSEDFNKAKKSFADLFC